MNVQISKLDPSVPLPQYETSGAAGFDLASNVDMTVAPGQVTLVRPVW
jgi:dUTPase